MKVIIVQGVQDIGKTTYCRKLDANFIPESVWDYNEEKPNYELIKENLNIDRPDGIIAFDNYPMWQVPGENGMPPGYLVKLKAILDELLPSYIIEIHVVHTSLENIFNGSGMYWNRKVRENGVYPSFIEVQEIINSKIDQAKFLIECNIATKVLFKFRVEDTYITSDITK